MVVIKLSGVMDYHCLHIRKEVPIPISLLEMNVHLLARYFHIRSESTSTHEDGMILMLGLPTVRVMINT